MRIDDLSNVIENSNFEMNVETLCFSTYKKGNSEEIAGPNQLKKAWLLTASSHGRARLFELEGKLTAGESKWQVRDGSKMLN